MGVGKIRAKTRVRIFFKGRKIMAKIRAKISDENKGKNKSKNKGRTKGKKIRAKNKGDK